MAQDDGRVAVGQNYFKFIQWDITARCNLACIHCRSNSFYGCTDLDKDMPFDQIQRRLSELSQRGVRRIHFLGGEPFTRQDLERIVRYASDLGIVCSINTNGTLISRKRAIAILEAGVFLLTFSIDGPDAATNDMIRGSGAFRRVTRGIRYVQEAKRQLSSRVRLICCNVLMRPNHRYVVGMVDLCTDLGLQNLIVTSLRRMGGAIERYAELSLSQAEQFAAAVQLAERLRERPHCNVQIECIGLLEKLYLNEKYGAGQQIGYGGCNAISHKAYVQPDGTLFPCQDVAKEIGQSKDRESVKAEGLDSWGSSRFQYILDGLRSRRAYDTYQPCCTCPALGRLCMPCPLPGLRRQRVVHEQCLFAMDLCKREGVDIEKAIEQAVSRTANERLLADASFRNEFFSVPHPASAIAGLCESPEATMRLSAFREDVLGALQRLLRKGVEDDARWSGTGIPVPTKLV